MRGRSVETSIALVASVIGVVVTIPYATHAGPAWYGLAFVSAGIALGLSGRAWSPAWIDARVRDAAAALSVTFGWLAFEGAYVDDNRLGAVVHLLAAAFYAGAALLDRSQLSLNRALELRTATPVRVASGWLYAAALTGTVGYLYALNVVPGPDGAQDLAALPIFALATGVAALAASSRYWRAEFRPHLYVIALLLAAFSLAVPAHRPLDGRHPHRLRRDLRARGRVGALARARRARRTVRPRRRPRLARLLRRARLDDRRCLRRHRPGARRARVDALVPRTPDGRARSRPPPPLTPSPHPPPASRYSPPPPTTATSMASRSSAPPSTAGRRSPSPSSACSPSRSRSPSAAAGSSRPPRSSCASRCSSASATSTRPTRRRTRSSSAST